MEKGLRCSGSVSYGFIPDPTDNNIWLIDEPATAIVRRIFQMVIDGKGVNEIGRTLRAEQIPIPSEQRKKAEAPPMPPKPPKERKPTKKERMKEIGTRLADGLPVTVKEQETYNAYMEKQRNYAREWQAQHRAKNLGHTPRTGPNLEDIKRRRRDGLPLTVEETAVYDAWREKKSEYQREWREKNEGYHREYSRQRYRGKKVEMAGVVG